MLNVRYLAVFRAVVKTGSISAAARHLHVSQPAVTKSVRLLEEDIGLPLFFRANGRLQLTPEAEALMPEVERLFGNVDAVQKLADEIRDGFSGSVSIATVTTLSAPVVANAVDHFQRQHPGIRFFIRSMSTRSVIDAVARHEADVGVTDVPPGGADLESQELCRADVGCIVPRGHPLARRKEVGPLELAKYPLICFSEETYTGRHLHAAFEDCGVPWQVAFTVNHTQTACTLVERGAGVAFVDVFQLIAGGFSGLKVVKFRPLIQTRPHVVFSRTRAVPLIARKFVGSLDHAVAAMQAGAGGLLDTRTEMGTGGLQRA